MVNLRNSFMIYAGIISHYFQGMMNTDHNPIQMKYSNTPFNNSRDLIFFQVILKLSKEKGSIATEDESEFKPKYFPKKHIPN